MPQVIGDLDVKKRRRGRPVGKSDILTVEELKTIMSLPDRRSLQGSRDYAVLLTLGNTPARKGEMVAMDTENLVNEGEKKYLIRKGLKKKGSRPYWKRTRISDQVYQGIKRYIDHDRERTPSSPLFRTLGKHGPYEPGRITPTAIDLIVQKYVVQAGIKKRITPHSFRATFTTLRKHLSPWDLMDLVGWDSVNSAMPYVRQTEKELEDATLEYQFA